MGTALVEPSSGVKAVIFDNDGTLVDTYDLIVASFNYALTKVLGKTLPEEVLMKKVGQPLKVQIADFTEDEDERQRIWDAYQEHNHRYHDEVVKAFPGLRESLQALRERGYRLAIVTSKRHEMTLRGLRVTGIEECFEFVVGADDWPEHKPAPGGIVHACELLDLAPRECAYVGDSPYDLQAANGAGVVSVAALWGMFPEEVLAAEGPDYKVATPEGLLELFRRP